MADRPPPPPPGPGAQQYPYGYDQSAYYASYYGQQGGWQQQQQQQQYGAWQQQQQAPPPPDQPPLPPGEPPPPPPPGGQQQAQQTQQQAQQQGYGWQGDYSAYYQQAYAQQQPGYQQQWPSGYGASGYYQQGYGQQGYPGHPPPPPQQPPPPGAAGGYAGARPGSGYAQPQAAQQPAANGSQQPAWKAAADRVAAAAAGSGSWAAPAHQKHQAQQAQQAQHAQQTYSPDTYNAVPPPAAIAGMTAAAAAAYGGGGRRTFSIRPQAPKPKQPEQVNPMVAAFNQAASKLTGSAAAAAAPAYTRVQVSPAAPQGLPPQQQHAAAAAAVPPQQWPPALKAYVERAFTTTDTRQRPKLQEILKQVIADAQASGELWTRDWEAMPLPDLNQSAADAAAVLAEVAAVSGPAGGAQARQGGSRWGTQQQAAGQSPYAAAQQYAAAQAQQYKQQQQQQQQYSQQQYAAQQRQMKQQQRQPKKWAQRQRVELDEERYGRRGRKRSWRDDRSDSSRSSDSDDGWSYQERQRRQRRAGRFADDGGSKGGGWRAEERRQWLQAQLEDGGEEDVDWDALAIKGTCQELEKSYFRLTSAPDPATVRPEPVLRSALERLVGLLRERRVNYFYALDQFKGMRQDCTVQHIRNDLAVQVYEAHARAALEYGDVAEYNQCQSQLRVLYNEGNSGSKVEFLAYRIIYQAVHARHGEILQLLNTLKKVKREEAAQPAVAHALSVRAALASADYQAFFRLYAAAPALGRALMDIYVPKLRFDALTVVVKAFKPSVPVSFLASMLGFVAPAARAEHAGQATPAAPAALASAGGGPAAGGGGTSPAAAAGGEGAGKSPGTQAAGESGAAAAAGPASEAGATPSDTAAATAAGAAALAEPNGSAAAPAAAAGGGAASADGPGSGLQEPPPGCMELYFVGDFAGQADEAQGWADCVAWLAECGAVLTDAHSPADATLDCKASTGQLKMPEEKEKVAHGDENLRLEDFLKSMA